MPKTLFGRCIYLFVGTLACATAMIGGLVLTGDICRLVKEESGKEEEVTDEMVHEDLD